MTTIIDQAIADISAVIDTVNSLGEDLANCPDGIMGVICYTNVIAEATVQITELPTKISILFDQAVTEISNIKPELERCAAVEIARAAAEIISIQTTVNTCIDNALAAKLN